MLNSELKQQVEGIALVAYDYITDQGAIWDVIEPMSQEDNYEEFVDTILAEMKLHLMSLKDTDGKENGI
jgi:hypothetical protein